MYQPRTATIEPNSVVVHRVTKRIGVVLVPVVANKPEPTSRVRFHGGREAGVLVKTAYLRVIEDD